MIRVENLVKAFPGTRAVDGVSFTVGRGEVVAAWRRPVRVRHC